MSTPTFPNRIIEIGDPDKATVTLIQQRLNAVGCGPIDEDGNFDPDTENAVKLFQSRFFDEKDRPLEVDGQVGSLTWGVLFGEDTVPSSAIAPSALTTAVITFATTQIGVLETMDASGNGLNRGTQVDQYQIAVGLSLPASPSAKGFFWCVAFTYFCYQQAASGLSITNPHIKTAGVLDHWNKAKTKPGVKRVLSSQAVANPSLIKPGALFIINHGGGLGHTGIVTEVKNGRLVTIEGNTNPNGSRNGIGVFKRDTRKIKDINMGFIDYS